LRISAVSIPVRPAVPEVIESGGPALVKVASLGLLRATKDAFTRPN
jgi:hypothetical protein